MTNTFKSAGLSVAITALLLLCSGNARSDNTTTQIESLINSGKLQQALVITEKQLAGDPANVNYLFLKGLILTRQNKMNDARDIFERLTRDHPELPEPYNNLAVIYAAQGDFNSARNALERAINTHPSYATAHENLGDIYAKMASNAYNHALEIDGGNATAREKLALINNLFSARPGSGDTTHGATPASDQEIKKDKEEISQLENKLTTLTKSNKQQEARAQALQAELQRLKSQRQQTELKSKQEYQAAQQQLQQTRSQLEKLKTQLAQLEDQRKLLARQTSTPASPALPSGAAQDSAAIKQEVIQAVKSWAAHWSARDVAGYLASYTGNYRPPDMGSHNAWVAQRRLRITRPRYIKVALKNIRVELRGTDQAEVNFEQHYQSDKFRDRIHKTLRLQREQGRWLIVGEKTG
jgi:predicted  nucleic acid-binding Zn-ribbon protein